MPTTSLPISKYPTSLTTSPQATHAGCKPVYISFLSFILIHSSFSTQCRLTCQWLAPALRRFYFSVHIIDQPTLGRSLFASDLFFFCLPCRYITTRPDHVTVAFSFVYSFSHTIYVLRYLHSSINTAVF